MTRINYPVHWNQAHGPLVFRLALVLDNRGLKRNWMAKKMWQLYEYLKEQQAHRLWLHGGRA